MSAPGQAAEGGAEVIGIQVQRARRRGQLSRLSKAALIAMCRAGVKNQAGTPVTIDGGIYPLEKWSHDDLIASITDTEFGGGAAA